MKNLIYILAAIAALFIPRAAFSQAYTSITATNVPMQTGQICFTGTDANDNQITYTPQGGSPISGPVCGTIVGGNLSGSLQVANVLTASPSTMSYRLTLVNAKSVYLTIRNVRVSGTSWDFGSYVLPATGIALGFGNPSMLCNAGAQFVSTDQQPSNWVCASSGTTTIWQTYPSQGYCPANSAYVTPKKGQSFCVALQNQGQGAPTGACTENGFYFQKDNGNAFLWGCVNGAWTQLQSSQGTVVSVGITSPNKQVTINGSPITDSGTITVTLSTTGNGSNFVTSDLSGTNGTCVMWSNGNLADGGGPCVVYTSEPANTVFAAPDGADGLPSFRHIVEHDLPFSYSGSTTELATVSGSLISGSIAAVGANGNLVNADSSYSFPGFIPDPSQVHGLAPSATIDTTNASNITSGTLNIARLPAANFTCPTGQLIRQFTLNDNTSTVCVPAAGVIGVGTYSYIPYYSSSPTGDSLSPDTVFHTDGNGNLVANTLQLQSNSTTSVLTINSLGGINAGCLYTDNAGNVISTKNGCGVNGTVTSVGIAPPSDLFSVSNSPITSSGVITISSNAQSAHTFWGGPDQDSGTAVPSFRNISLVDLPSSPNWSLSGSYILGGPTASCDGTAPLSCYAARWRHIVGDDFGAIGAGLVLAGPTSGSSLPTFRSIATSDLPVTIFKSLPTQCATNQYPSGIDQNGNAYGCSAAAGGSVTSVGLSLPGMFTVTGSPVTTTGTLTATLASQSAGTIFAAPSATSGTPSFRTLTTADIAAAGTLSNSTSGSSGSTLSLNLSSTPTQCSGGQLSIGIDIHGNANCGSAGAVTSVGLSLPGIFTVSGSPITTSGTLSATLNTQTPNVVWAGPASGSTAVAPTFRSLVTKDLPTQIFQSTPTQCAAGTYSSGIDVNGNAQCVAAGSVTSVGLSLPSIFTVTGSPVTTTGTLTATLASESQNLVLASPDGSSGTPSFRALTTTDIPSTLNPQSITILKKSGICGTATGWGNGLFNVGNCQNFSSNTVFNGISFDNNPTNPYTSGFVGMRMFNTSDSQASQVQTGGLFVYPDGAGNGNWNFITGPSTLVGTVPSVGGYVSPSTGIIGFQSGASITNTTTSGLDSGISRCGSNCIAAGNGTSGDGSATVDLGSINFGSSVGTLSPSGGNLVLAPTSGVVFQVSGDTTITGAVIMNNTLSVASTSNLNATNFGANATLLALNPATSTQNYGSTSLQFKGSFWNGSAPADTLWTLQNQVGSGTSPTQTLTFTASGSSGAAVVQMPELNLQNLVSHDGCLTSLAGVITPTGVPCGTGGGGGSVTSVSVGDLSPIFTSSVATPTSTPAVTYTLSNAPAHTFLGNTASGSAAPSYSSITVNDLPTLTSAKLPTDTAYLDVAQSWTALQTMQNLTVSGTGTFSGLTAGRCVHTTTGGALAVTSFDCQQGTVTSVAVTVPTQMTITGSPITTSGTIALGLNTLGTGGKIATGTAAGTSGHSVIWTSSGDLGDGGALGTVSSVALASSGIFTVSGSPVTTSGTLTLGVSGTSGGIPYFSGATTLSSSTALTAHGVIIGEGAGNAPVATASGTSGQCLLSGGSSADPTWGACSATGGTVTSVALSLPGIFSVSGSPVTTSGTLAATLATETANTIFAGPSSGSAASPTFRSMANADLPAGALQTNSGSALASGGCLQTTTGGKVVLVAGSCITTGHNLTVDTNQNVTGQKTFNAQQAFTQNVLLQNQGYGDTWQISSSHPSTGNGTFGAQVTYATGNTPFGIAAGDFNKDGYLDVVVTNETSNTMSVYINNGNGTFAAKVDYGTNANPYGVIVADFNQDGYPDIAVVCLGSNLIDVFLNNGNGTFGSASTYSQGAGTGPYQIAFGDFNGDGYPDMAVTSNTSGSAVGVYINRGDGTFNSVVGYSVGANPSGVAVADFNGDGKLDIVTANSGTTTISVLLGNGDGTFQTQSTYTTLTTPNMVAVADFNQDGHPDIVVTDKGSSKVSVFINNGNGTFATKVDYTTGSSPNGVTSGDFNGDGYPDMAVSNGSGGTVSILLNNGNGTFATKVDYTVSATPQIVASGDFTGSGIASVVVANSGSTTWSYLAGQGSSSTTNILNMQHTAGVASGAVEIPSLMLQTQQTPATSTSSCIANTMVFDSNYIYICTSTNNWKRSALSTF